MESFTYAVQGLFYSFGTQRNMRIHALLAVLVILTAMALGLSRSELAILALTVGIVITAELINTAIEATIDLITKEYHPLAAVAKNVAAAAVLIAACTAAAVGYFLFFERLSAGLYQKAVGDIGATPPYLTFASLVLVLIAVLLIKTVTSTVAKLQGGMPSGHVAVSFSMATSVFYVSNSGLAVLLSFVIAALVAQSRVEGRIHSVLEVLAGAALGIVITVLVFQFWR